MNSKILLPQNIIDRFKKQAVRDYPHECCGFLIGNVENNHVEAVEYIPAKNSMNERKERRYSIDPLEYLKAENHADSNNMTLIGIVHSHPDNPAEPSEFDRNHAFSGFSYIIVSVDEDSINGFRSWRLKENREKFVEENIQIKP